MSEQIDIQKLIEEQNSWQKRNPLFQWREQNNIKSDRVALLLGVSSQSVIQWQKGAWFPNEENFKKLGRLMGTKFLVGRWKDWYKQKPEF